MVSTDGLPVTKAKTAYQLLSEIIELILDEPKRYDQGKALEFRESPHPHRCHAYHAPRHDSIFPSCGTIGCVAGWVVVLARPAYLRTVRGRYVWPTDVTDIAENVLGLNGAQAWELFATDAAGRGGGSLGHAQRGAKHIRAFQRLLATQLKRTRIQVQQ